MKLSQKIVPILVFAVMLTFSFGFQKDKSKEAEIQALIDAKVAEKVEYFRRKRIQACRERVFQRASEIADSIIISRAKSTTIIDNTTRPVPPERPVRPPIRPPIDTTPVTPLFQEEVDTNQ